MAKMEFKFGGTVTPEQLRHATKPVIPIPYKMDVELLEAIKQYTGGKRTGIGEFAQDAIKLYLPDLDTVLIAGVETKSRQRLNDSRPSMVQIDAEPADQLQQAAEFLKEKGYSRFGRGSVMVACCLLHADALNLLKPDAAPAKGIAQPKGRK